MIPNQPTYNQCNQCNQCKRYSLKPLKIRYNHFNHPELTCKLCISYYNNPNTRNKLISPILINNRTILKQSFQGSNESYVLYATHFIPGGSIPYILYIRTKPDKTFKISLYPYDKSLIPKSLAESLKPKELLQLVKNLYPSRACDTPAFDLYIGVNSLKMFHRVLGLLLNKLHIRLNSRIIGSNKRYIGNVIVESVYDDSIDDTI